MSMNRGSYTVKDWEGQTHSIEGDPTVLTLRDALSQLPTSGKTGGELSGVQFRVGSKEYRDNDLNKSFRDLGIQPGTTIEVVKN